MKTILCLILVLPTAAWSDDYFASQSEPYAKLLFQPLKKNKSLFPVILNEINGKQVMLREHISYLKPGEYELGFATLIDNRYTRTTVRSVKNKTNRKLNIKLEEGKTYHIAYDAHARDRSEWKPIVWKTTE